MEVDVVLAVRPASVVLDDAGRPDTVEGILERGKDQRRGEEWRYGGALQVERVAVVDRECVRDDRVLVDATSVTAMDLSDAQVHPWIPGAHRTGRPVRCAHVRTRSS